VHILSRRQAFQLLGVAGASALVAACSTGTDEKAGGPTTTSTVKSPGGSGGTADTACAKSTPAETAGPFPADGSNGPNVLGEEGEVFGSPGSAVAGENASLTSQIALPEDACKRVYDYDKGYGDSAKNISNMKLESDSVFGDGSDAQLSTVSGDPDSALLVTMTIGVGEKPTAAPPPGPSPG
jgi:hypothetical protein